MDFVVDAAMLVNEGGVHCVPLVFARPLEPDRPITLGDRAYLGAARVIAIDEAQANARGPGLVAFVLEDPMDVRSFTPGAIVRLE